MRRCRLGERARGAAKGALADGEAAVINAEGETMLAATSGTSGNVALLPTTTAMRQTFFARGILRWPGALPQTRGRARRFW